jgi:hypothetical protein
MIRLAASPQVASGRQMYRRLVAVLCGALAFVLAPMKDASASTAPTHAVTIATPALSAMQVAIVETGTALPSVPIATITVEDSRYAGINTGATTNRHQVDAEVTPGSYKNSAVTTASPLTPCKTTRLYQPAGTTLAITGTPLIGRLTRLDACDGPLTPPIAPALFT